MARGGVKGRSGRKSNHDEQKLTVLLNRSYEVALEFINSDAPLKDRAELAAKFVIKSIPTDPLVKVGGDGGNTYVHIYRPEPYGTEVLETASRSPDRSV